MLPWSLIQTILTTNSVTIAELAATARRSSLNSTRLRFDVRENSESAAASQSRNISKVRKIISWALVCPDAQPASRIQASFPSILSTQYRVAALQVGLASWQLPAGNLRIALLSQPKTTHHTESGTDYFGFEYRCYEYTYGCEENNKNVYFAATAGVLTVTCCFCCLCVSWWCASCCCPEEPAEGPRPRHSERPPPLFSDRYNVSASGQLQFSGSGYTDVPVVLPLASHPAGGNPGLPGAPPASAAPPSAWPHASPIPSPSSGRPAPRLPAASLRSNSSNNSFGRPFEVPSEAQLDRANMFEENRGAPIDGMQQGDQEGPPGPASSSGGGQEEARRPTDDLPFEEALATEEFVQASSFCFEDELSSAGGVVTGTVQSATRASLPIPEGGEAIGLPVIGHGGGNLSAGGSDGVPVLAVTGVGVAGDSSEPRRRITDEPFVDVEEGANEALDEPGEPVNTDEINRLKKKIMHLQEETLGKPKAERRAARAEIQQLQEELEMQLQGYSEYRSMGASPPRPPAPCS